MAGAGEVFKVDWKAAAAVPVQPSVDEIRMRGGNPKAKPFPWRKDPGGKPTLFLASVQQSAGARPLS